MDLLIDTDMGGDIDDALALSMALKDDSIHVRGITTVYTANAWRTDLVRRMVRVYRRDAPVYAGAEKPLMGTWGQEECGRNDAADFLCAQAEKGPVTLLAIGPLTNVAAALLKNPGIAQNLRMFIMGGMIGCAYPEWNIQCDPEAAQIVLTSGADITLVGLDVTEKCRLTEKEAWDLVRGEDASMKFLHGEMQRFFDQFHFLPTLHDPLALLCLLKEDICQYEMKDIQVETQGKWTRGVTVDCRFSEKKRIRTAVSVRAEEAVREICRRVRGE